MTKFNIHGAEGYTKKYTPSEVIAKDIYGQNMGNMLFYGSVYNAVSKNKNNIIQTSRAIEVINEADYYLMPQANLFYKYFSKNIEGHIRRMKEISIPTIIVGVGYQSSVGASSFENEDPQLNKLVKEFVSSVLENSASIGVRGQITKKYLLNLGFAESDIDIIGCPSVRFFGSELDLVAREYPDFSANMKIAVNYTPTRYNNAWGKVITNIFKEYKNSYAILQDKYEINNLSWKFPNVVLPKIPEKIKKLSDIPVTPMHPVFKENRGRVFTDANQWINSMKTFDFSIGTRIHGNIASILAGTPSLVIAIDTRTLELAEYFKIPYVMLSDLDKYPNLESLYNKAIEDMPLFYDNYSNILKDYHSFFKKNGIII
ncbi:polysaccharide pyruvyl transferase family protein [Lactococcus formosensis]|uniref:Polysaccharide pyruvyl transferase family protein n=1 Tax=Lactococcus formosensis TaxID=1281486 RepID=A0A9X4SAS4_9LACT|nr:polysaccharide pyruvyl transferase family protein [Lactococcus formosensis]MDG6111043.1 polysaccharide pyruvyl transferase family protein [Lactococcus formosensis]MDG6117349.1 polysaccharide pyruvyl transferase family protein [Lactococcus formosensis]MDG6132806.1 polysaccharide pyruvyl transferase family protein [Lactococcus formosensis]MDG6134801.1 polysaccharide pyruvyl transferase family protein [Lactococcus formosensis]MDG6137812.1 polysaccharide pyruvyl transferase family protein [Lact